MTRPTEGASCPVCGEALAERPERCFRCETALGPWWAFEEALRGAAPTPVRPGRSWPVLAVAAAAGLALGVVVMAGLRPAVPPTAPAELTIPPPPPGPTPPPPPGADGGVLSYRVQRGDSLWRISAALTGEGARWRELWPEHEGGAGRVVAGTVLRIDLSRLEPR
jgi:hypothetical protein